eukprot:scaffold31358_cov78-Skeletonema_dohrnii-CCMP3373.AAC.2
MLLELALIHCDDPRWWMEYLDLELVRQFEEPWLVDKDSDERELDEIKLCEGHVCDILDDILREEGNSLRRFQYPYKWYDNAVEPNAIKRLYGGSQEYQIMRAERFNQFVSDHKAVVNKFTCCLHFGCADGRAICVSLEENRPPEDDANICIDCGDTRYLFCTHCNEILCVECCGTNECSVCNIRYCPSCSKDNGFAKVTYCDDADDGDYCELFCSSCRLDSCIHGNTCGGCREETFDALLEECNAKQARIDVQRLEIEKLYRNTNIVNAGRLGDDIISNFPNADGEEQTKEEVQSESDCCCECRYDNCGYDNCGYCSRCNLYLCLKERDVFACSDCNIRFCVDCDELGLGCKACDGDESYCKKCRLKRCRSDGNDCSDCKVRAFNALLEEYNMKPAQIDSQKVEIERLRQG